MRGHEEFIEHHDVALAQDRCDGGEHIHRGRVQIRIHLDQQLSGALEFRQETGQGVLKQPYVESRSLIRDIRQLRTRGHCAGFENAPIFRQSREGVETVKSGRCVLLISYPPLERMPLCHTEFQVSDRTIAHTVRQEVLVELGAFAVIPTR